ncbi:hypothetical protein F4777DRAFT_584523 [Nemania sp. FL0916]|nr:hypothetical protein F4777DRAFT_584523 [Nemania sp. FL0916]
MSSTSVNPSQTLTPASVIRTDVPFPTAPQSSEGIVRNVYSGEWRPHESRKLKIEACSELMKYQFALDVFSVAAGGNPHTNPLAMIHDKHGQQIVFSIGGQQHLYALCYVKNAAEGWQAIDLTPPGDELVAVDAFDVLQNDNMVYIAVAVRIGEVDNVLEGRDRLKLHRIFWTSFELPTLSSSGSTVQGFSGGDLVWTKIPNNRGDKSVTSIKCAASTTGNQPFWLAVATAATKSETATYYTVNTYPEHQAPWDYVSLVESSDRIHKISPAILGSVDDNQRRPGMASLYQRQSDNKQSCTVDLLDSTLTKRMTTRVLLTGKLGQLRNMATSNTPWGASDVFIASEKGIGYYSSEELETLHSTILPDISFQQVVASEVSASVASDPTLYSQFNILAVSDEGGLYFITGKRYEDRSIKFFASGIPIRSGVRMLSSQYNANANTNEILYVPNSANQICHLAQDPSTCLWNESIISVQPPPRKAKSYHADAFVTTITITDEDDVPVPDDYPLQITSEAVQVSVNSRSFTLSAKPLTLRTSGGSGQITIVARSHSLLGAADYKLKLTEFAKGTATSEFIIQPSQRVVRLMSSIKSANDLRGVTDMKGNHIFKGIDSEKLDTTADVMSQMISAANGTTGKSGATSTPSSITWEKDSSGSVKTSNESSWFDKAVKAVGSFIGDVIEGLKTATKFLVKCAVKIVGPVVQLIVKVGMKILSFTLKGVGVILKGLCGFLADFCGIDMSAILRWVSFIFDGDSTQRTQKAIMDFTKGGLTACGRLLVENRASVSDMFLDLREYLKEHIDDPRPVLETGKPKKSVLAKLLNNPIIKAILKFNPIAWIIEAITEEVDTSDWKIPNVEKFASFAAKHALDGVDTIATCFLNIISELVTAGGDVISDPSSLRDVIMRVLKSSVWEIFDAVESTALSIYDMIVDLFGMLYEFLTGEWVIPGLTDLWEDFSGQPFSILGFGTYLLSTLLNISSMLIAGKLPFEDVQLINWDVLPIPRFYKSSKSQNPPPRSDDISVNMVQMPKYEYEAVLKQPVVGSTQWTTARRISKGLLLAVSEIIGALITYKEIVVDADFVPRNPEIPREQGQGFVNRVANMSHRMELSLLGLSAASRILYTVIRVTDDHPPAPHAALWVSAGMDVAAVGLLMKHYITPSIVTMQVASGLRAIAETVESGIHKEHWFHHTTELVHITGAGLAVGSVIAKRKGWLSLAVPLTVADCGASCAAGVGGVIYALVPEDEGKKHEGGR